MHLSTVFSAAAALLAASALAAPVTPDERAARGDLGLGPWLRQHVSLPELSLPRVSRPKLSPIGGFWGMPYVSSLTTSSLPREEADWSQWTRRHSSPAGHANVASFGPDRNAVKVCVIVLKTQEKREKKNSPSLSLSLSLLSFFVLSCSWPHLFFIPPFPPLLLFF
jgi:hypothetical protein